MNEGGGVVISTAWILGIIPAVTLAFVGLIKYIENKLSSENEHLKAERDGLKEAIDLKSDEFLKVVEKYGRLSGEHAQCPEQIRVIREQLQSTNDQLAKTNGMVELLFTKGHT